MNLEKLTLILLALVLTGGSCTGVSGAADRERALRREINRGGGVAANAHELVVLFNINQKSDRFLFIFNLNQSSYLRKDVAVVDYGYPVAAAEIEVDGRTLRVVIPEMRPVGVNRFIDQSFAKGDFNGKDLEGQINATLEKHIESSKYRCDILYSTTRTFFETLARKYGYSLDFRVRDSTCQASTPGHIKAADKTTADTAVGSAVGEAEGAAGKAKRSLLGKIF